MSRTIEIEYEVPEYDSLKERLVAAAQVSDDGNTITLANQTATRSRGLLRLSETWTVAQAGPDSSEALSVKLSGYTAEDARNTVIEVLAGREAERNITPEMKNTAIKSALQAKLDSI